jgi:hypothetical protein
MAGEEDAELRRAVAVDIGIDGRVAALGHHLKFGNIAPVTAFKSPHSNFN